eukprot:6183115-Pleurochrysis_carterae.AAC.1
MDWWCDDAVKANTAPASFWRRRSCSVQTVACTFSTATVYRVQLRVAPHARSLRSLCRITFQAAARALKSSVIAL